MKQFKELRSNILEAKKMKVKGIKIEIVKTGNKFKAMVDGDLLDTYSSEKEAEKMAKEFVKQYKG